MADSDSDSYVAENLSDDDRSSQYSSESSSAGSDFSTASQEEEYHIEVTQDVARPELDELDKKGYLPLQLRYEKKLRVASELDKINRGFLNYGRWVEVFFPDEHNSRLRYKQGRVVSHQKCWRRNKRTGGLIHYAANDTLDVRLPNGDRLLDVGIKRVSPIHIYYFPLLCNYTCEDACLFFNCVCFTISLFGLIFGVLMYASADSTIFSTALWAYFFGAAIFVVCVVVSVYVHRLSLRIGDHDHDEDSSDGESSESSLESENEDEKDELL